MDTVAPSTDSPGHDMASDNARFLEELWTIVGHSHVLTSPESTQRYRTGFRFGTGPALAVVRPGSLVDSGNS
jgi:D-lactate dehydrogenase